MYFTYIKFFPQRRSGFCFLGCTYFKIDIMLAITDNLISANFSKTLVNCLKFTKFDKVFSHHRFTLYGNNMKKWVTFYDSPKIMKTVSYAF